MGKILIFALAWVSASCAASGPVASELGGFEKSRLEIQTRLGTVKFEIYLAMTPEQQEQGLMFVKKLSANTGMLFPQRMPSVVNMWMKNTLIPLDLLFIGADGRVACLHKRAVPESLELISCAVPVQEVLEIAGGEAEKFGIEVGSRVRHPNFVR
jgi:uncharacterized membrane protein (UPF0127 family)